MCVCARATCAVCGAVVHRPAAARLDRERPVVGGIIVRNGFEGRSFSTTIFPDEIWQCRFCTAATTVVVVVTLGRPAPTENNNYCTSSHDNAHRRSNITIFVTFCSDGKSEIKKIVDVLSVIARVPSVCAADKLTSSTSL